MYSYSIIIPHKGIPDLLERSLDSIPLRNDIQIIVVDDNSQLTDEEFASFPGLGRPNTEVIFTKEGRGAGYARNVGLKYAKGKWLIFADADDYFVDNFSDLLDKYLSDEADVIYFKPTSVQFLTEGRESERVKNYQDLFSYNNLFLRYAFITPWGKFIKREYIERGHFQFSEVRWSNDSFFMTQVGTSTQNVKITDDILYVVDERDGSLTREKVVTDEEFECRVKQDILAYNYAEGVGFPPFEDILLGRCQTLIEKHRWYLLCRVFHSLPNSAYPNIRRRLLHQISLKGSVLFHTLFLVAPLTKKIR